MKERNERSDKDKLDATKARLKKLTTRLESIIEQLNPLEDERDKLQRDIKYYEGRVKKLTARLSIYRKEAKYG